MDNPVAKIEAFLRDGKRPAAQAVIESERAAKRLDPDLRSLEGGAAVARVKGTATGDGLEAASRWLAEESEPYRGDWVLLDGDRVVYHGPSESTGRSHAASLTHPVLVFVE
ncbi:MAG: hypothetical protein HY791_22475 [Deltaproteobacteria bacterium]|nr:hypothetical protein [Deltaproteobacteria bacterium]